MTSNYDNSAWFYDRFSRLVYGNALINAQLYLLQFIPPDSNILIVGGGTGWILEEIARLHPAGLQITYVEISAKMMAQSRKRNIAENKITFINDAVENTMKSNYDVVITCFLFDNFGDTTLQNVFTHIHSQLKPTGLWLNADFQLTGQWWQKLLLNGMLLFFRLLCRIEARKLPDIKNIFQLNGYRVLTSHEFFGKFILAEVMVKSKF